MPVNLKSGKSYKVVQGAGGVWHVYGGRRVWVPLRNTQAVAGGGTGQPFATPEEITNAIAAGLISPESVGQPAAQDFDHGVVETPTSPVDALYLAEEAKRQAQLDAERARLAQEGAYDRSDFQEALRRMGIAKTKDEQTTRVNANRRGLFFSGQLGKEVGELGVSYAQRQGDAQQSFDRREAARQAAVAALDQGYTLDQAAGLAASADRKLQADQEAALAGYLVKEPSPAPAAAPVVATAAKPAVAKKKAVTTTGFNRKRNQRFRVINRGGKIFHTYAGGRPVRVG